MTVTMGSRKFLYTDKVKTILGPNSVMSCTTIIPTHVIANTYLHTFWALSSTLAPAVSSTWLL